MAEIVTAERWLFGKLSGDGTLRSLVSGVYPVPAPREAQFPYVLYQSQSPSDIRGVGPNRVGTSGEWLVRAVFETSTFGGDLESAADRIETLLQAASGVGIWACVRVRPFQLVENSGARPIRHLGGFYRLWVAVS